MNQKSFLQSNLLSSAIPFPPISWWQLAVSFQNVTLDAFEHYQKMSMRNRYFLAGPQGGLLMSIPLQNGRNQHTTTGKVLADSQSDWQTKHWRTIQSFYGRSPYFEFYADALYPLFKNDGTDINLMSWCRRSIEIVADLLDFPINLSITENYQSNYPGSFLDVRFKSSGNLINALPAISYHQVFQDRTGFIGNCSVLDLLFCEGVRAKTLLVKTK